MPRRRKLIARVTKLRGPKRMVTDPNQTPLADAMSWLGQHMDSQGGAICPCCGRFAKVYRRTIHRTMAVVLILMARRTPRGAFFHVPRYLAGLDLAPAFQAVATHGGDYAKLRNWGLIESQPGERDDGSKRTGFWRVTEQGFAFVHDRITVPAHAVEFDNRLMGLDDSDSVGIRDCLGAAFDYAKLMRA